MPHFFLANFLIRFLLSPALLGAIFFGLSTLAFAQTTTAPEATATPTVDTEAPPPAPTGKDYGAPQSLEQPAFATNKRIAAGDFFVSASTSFSRLNTAGSKSSNFSLIGTTGYFFARGVALGASAYFFNSSDRDAYLSLGSLARWYFWEAERLTTYAQADAKFGVTETAPDLQLVGRAGLQYFITPNVALGPELSYTYGKGGSLNLHSFEFAGFFSIHL